MGFQQRLEQRFLLGGGELADGHDLGVHPLAQAARLIEQEGHTTGHAGSHVAAGAAEHHHHTASHVFAAVVAGAFHHGAGTAVAHGEALSGAAQGEQLTAGGAVEAGVAQDHLAAGVAAAGRGHHADATTVDALAHVIVGFTHQAHIHALHGEGAEALAGGTFIGEIQLPLEASVAMAGSDLTAKAGANAAIGVDDRQAAGQAAMALDRGQQLGIGQQLVFEDRAIAVGFSVVLEPTAIGRLRDGIKQAGQIDRFGFGQLHGARLEQLGATDQILEPRHAEHAQELTHLFRHEQEEVHHVLGDAGEALAQRFLLGGHTHRAVIGVANAGHDAALGDHRDRTEAVFLSTEQGGDDHVPAGLKAAIGA